MVEVSRQGLGHQRKARARQDGRHAAQNMPVNDLRLRPVSDLGGATEVGGGWQKRILYDGAQQRARRKGFGCFFKLGEQLFAGKLGPAHGEFAVAQTDGLAASLHIEKEQGGFARDFDLGVKAAGFEFL